MRNGKIARLPSAIRDDLNLRMEEGEDGPKLLDWLNGLPEVQETLKESFDGVPINKQNLSDWRHGGYREWHIQHEFVSHACQLSESCASMGDVIDAPLLAGDLVAAVATRYAALLNTWDGGAEPKFEMKLRLLHGVTRDISLLQRTIQRASQQEKEFHQQLKDEEKEALDEVKNKALAPIWAALRSKPLAKILGGGKDGQELADFITALQYGLPLPKTAPPDPSGQAQSSPVKPENEV